MIELETGGQRNESIKNRFYLFAHGLGFFHGRNDPVGGISRSVKTARNKTL